jgi:4-amino-4-deoxy-L-arabinose transferase-like glycosyltransferase
MQYFSNLIQSRKNVILFCVILLLIYSVIFMNISEFDNSVPFFGDAIEYQSMGVNFAKGHGIQKSGGIEDFGEYKFSEKPVNPGKGFFVKTDIHDFQQNIRNDFYREPAYPLFLGIIYKISGTNPENVKYIQLLLMLIIASFLPLIGHIFWGKEGFISGLISGLVFIFFNIDMIGLILTEILVSFTVFIIICSYIFYLNRKNTISSLLLGIAFGIGLLVKGSLTLIPFLYLIYVINKYLRNNEIKYLKHFSLIVISFILTILPWIIYSNFINKKEIEKRKLDDITLVCKSRDMVLSLKNFKIDSLKNVKYRFFLISTQSQRLLLNAHNEFVPELTQAGQYNFPEGGWLPKWRTVKGSFYNNDKMNGESAFARVINFYRNYPHKIFQLMIQKIILSFSNFKFLWLIILLYILESYSNMINYISKRNPDRLLISLSLFLLIAGITGIYFIHPPDKHSILIICFFTLLIILPVLIFNLFVKQRNILIKIPPIFTIIFINFFLITILVFGFQRLIQVIDFVIILVAVEYLILFLRERILLISDEK